MTTITAITANFWQWIEPIHSGTRGFLVFIGIIAVLAALGFACLLINSIYRRRTEMNFKRELLERGLTIDEIERLAAVKSNETS